MKNKIVVFALIGALLLALSVPAAAADVGLYPYFFTCSSNADRSYPLNGEGQELESLYTSNGVYTPIAITNTSDSYILDLTFTITDATYSSYIEFSQIKFVNSLGSKYSSDSYTTVSASGMSYSDQYFSVTADYGIVRQPPATDGSPYTLNCILTCTLSMVIDGDFPYDGVQIFFKNGCLGLVDSNPNSLVGSVTLLAVSGATMGDLVDATQAVRDTVGNGVTSITSALASQSEAIKSSMNSQTQQMTATLEELQEAINSMSEGLSAAVEEGTENALEKFYEKVKQEASDKLASAVAQIQEAMPVDVVALQGSFDQLYQSMSTHEKTATMTFPAGDLTLMGQTYRFWAPQHISFDQYFELPGMSLLLIPLRFMFVFGMGKYLMAYFSKIEKLITLHTSGGGE